jgi:hypothetical protein
MITRQLSVIALLAIAACDTRGTPESDFVPSSTVPAPADTLDRLLTIRPDGIGHASAGFTIADLRRALPPGATIGELDQQYMVDVTAIPVILAGDTLYHLLFAGRETIDDTVSLEMVATGNPKARTIDGIGPGMTLADAVAIGGAPTLTFNTSDESREYVRFAAQPATVLFRVRGQGDTFFAGTYTTSGESNSTTQYDPAARIFMVMVDLRRYAPQ